MTTPARAHVHHYTEPALLGDRCGTCQGDASVRATWTVNRPRGSYTATQHLCDLCLPAADAMHRATRTVALVDDYDRAGMEQDKLARYQREQDEEDRRRGD